MLAETPEQKEVFDTLPQDLQELLQALANKRAMVLPATAIRLLLEAEVGCMTV
jgi:hypothetical protein